MLKEFENKEDSSAPACSLVTMLPEDINLLNKHKINNYVLSNKHCRRQAKTDMVELAHHLFPEQKKAID